MKKLIELMEVFISAKDRSSQHVDRIEGHLIRHFRESEMFEELSPKVASYSPGAGENYLGEEDLVAEFRYAIRRLQEDEELENGN